MEFGLVETVPLIDRFDSAPVIREAHGDLLLSYRCARDPKCFTVLCFINCSSHFLGWPSASEIEKHPCYVEGLQPFQVHAFYHDGKPWRWIVSMTESTLDLEAEELIVLVEEVAALNSTSALELEINKRYNN